MSDLEGEQLGVLIQAYARAKWGRGADTPTTARLGARIDRQLRDRIDVLGSDGERLLDVEPGKVLAALHALELEAAREDAGAESAAAKVRAQGQTNTRDAAPSTRRAAPRREQPPRPGKQREPARNGRRRQRAQR